jgi:hypothetical protein
LDYFDYCYSPISVFKFINYQPEVTDSCELVAESIGSTDDPLIAVQFSDTDCDGIWDSIKLLKGDDYFLGPMWSLDSPEITTVSLYDIGRDGTIGEKVMTNCKMAAAVVDMSDLEDKKMDGYDNNYCMRYENKWANRLRWLSYGLTFGGTIVTHVLSGGTSTFMVAAIGTAVTTGFELNSEYNQIWPDSG